MNRPSSLQLAERCGHAPRLAEQFPECVPAGEKGDEVHADIELSWQAMTEPKTPQGRAALQWLKGFIGITGARLIGLEVKVRLVDPEDSENVITEGTADVLMRLGDTIIVCDWKTGNPDNVTHPDDNLQFLAYGLGAALEHGATSFRSIAVFLSEEDGEGKADPVEGRPFLAEEWWLLLDRLKRAASKEPIPVVGAHCNGCYARSHCYAWLLPAYEAAEEAKKDKDPAALVPFTKPGGLTHENAPAAVMLVKRMEDMLEIAKAQLKTFADKNGGIRISDDKVYSGRDYMGRETAKVTTLRKGVSCGGCGGHVPLAHLITRARDYRKYEVRKARR